MTKIKILIIEDVLEMAEMIDAVIRTHEGFKSFGHVQSVADARIKLMKNRPSVALLDEIMPGESPIDFVDFCVNDGINVVLMTGIENPTHAIHPDALGRVVKPSESDFQRGRTSAFLNEIKKLTDPI